MADTETQTPVEGTPVDDVEMGEGVVDDATATAAGESQVVETVPETPKLILFAE